MKITNTKLLSLLTLALLITTAHAKEKTPMTTEFQAKLNDVSKVTQAESFFKLRDSKFKSVTHRLFDINDTFAKNNILVRYRDKESKVDFAVKFRFPYSAEMINLLSRCIVDQQHCFGDQKIEINRYSNNVDDAIELSFEKTLKKADLGMTSQETLSQSQILSYFSQLQNDMKEKMTLLLAEHSDSHLFSDINQKIRIVSDTDVHAWKNTSTFQRDKWTMVCPPLTKDGACTYPEVTIEATHSANPSMEISTRRDGDIKDSSFFRDLRLSGLSI